MQTDKFLIELIDYQTRVEKYVADNRSPLLKDESLQIREEEEYLQENSASCHFSNIQLSQYDKTELHQLLTTQFYNPRLLEMISCMINTVALVPDYDELPGKQLRIRNFITDLRTLASGAYGQTFEASLLHGNRDFIIKVPKEKTEDLIHEYFIGRFLNRLRSIIPNFAYTYAGFTCSPPILTSTSNKTNIKTINWCARKPGFQYIVQEKINGQTLRKVLPKIGISTFMSILLQITLALAEAHRQFQFTHYDLHSGNIIIRDLENRFSLPYPSPKGNVYVNTQYLATLIDFGNGHISIDIKNKKTSFGKYFLEVYGITNRSFPLYDIFTFLADCYYTGPQLRYSIGLLFQFFNITDPLFLFSKDPLGEVFLPPIEPWISKTHWDFINYLRERVPEFYMGIFGDKPLNQPLNCKANACLNNQQLISSLHLQVDRIDNILDFYDLIHTSPEKKDYWASKFNLVEGLKQLDEMYDENVDFYTSLTVNPPAEVHLEGQSINDLYDLDLQHRYFLYLQYLAQVTEVLDNLELIRNIYLSIYPKYMPKFLNQKLEDEIGFQQTRLDNIRYDYNFIDKFINSDEYIQNEKFKRFYQFVKTFHFQA